MAKTIKQEIDGSNNTQQAIEEQNNYYLTNGVTEKEVRDITTSVCNGICGQYFLISQETVNSRLNNFEGLFLKKFDELEHKYEPLKDPAFAYSFREAEIQAAMTDDESSYEMLIELLARREAKKNDKHSITGIQGAIRIVNEVDEQSLVALTVINSVIIGIHSTLSMPSLGLNVLDNMYKSILTTDLPTGYDWQDQLDILKAVRVSSIQTFKKFEEILFDQYKNGSYMSVGLKLDSDEYKQAVDLLKTTGGISLMKNPFLDDYYVLPFTTCNSVKNVDNLFKNADAALKEKLVETINKVYELYEKDPIKLNDVKTKFINEWDSRKHLNIIHTWWNSLEHYCAITSIGRVLGHAYAQKCYKGFPPLD